MVGEHVSSPHRYCQNEELDEHGDPELAVSSPHRYCQNAVQHQLDPLSLLRFKPS